MYIVLCVSLPYDGYSAIKILWKLKRTFFVVIIICCCCYCCCCWGRNSGKKQIVQLLILFTRILHCPKETMTKADIRNLYSLTWGNRGGTHSVYVLHEYRPKRNEQKKECEREKNANNCWKITIWAGHTNSVYTCYVMREEREQTVGTLFHAKIKPNFLSVFKAHEFRTQFRFRAFNYSDHWPDESLPYKYIINTYTRFGSLAR